MRRHPYSITSEERKSVPFFLAVLAMFSAFALTAFYDAIHWSPPACVDAPGTLALYGIYYWLFKMYGWRSKLLRRVAVISTPLLEGAWTGTTQTSHEGEAGPVKAVEVNIGQDWTDICITLRSDASNSHSTSASMTVSPDGAVLVYEYMNTPLPGQVDTMQIHFGTARLSLAGENTLEGDYYSGRGRQTIGRLQLKRKRA